MKMRVLPLAIDLGAKNTGVFSAFYDKGTKLSSLETKQGKVYELSNGSYTLLMDSRTSKRHQRRGLDRKQLVKRLFKLIWTEQLNLDWDSYTQQTISFLLNRRGFSFLEEKHDSKYFEKFPTDAIEILPEQLRLDTNTSDNYDLNSMILETLENDTFKDVYTEIDNNIKQVKKSIVKANTVNIIKFAIDEKISIGEINPTKQNKFDDLKKVSLWIVDELFDANIVAYIEKSDNYSRNILSYISSLSYDNLENLKQNLPNLSLDDYKNSFWNFNISSFNLESEANVKKLEEGDIKSHIHHLAYALHNIKKELDEGSRHRSKYFEEIANVLLEQNHQEPYLKTFCEKLHSKKFGNLNVKNLTNLIGNISNLELKPLRKYFNDKAHAKGDYWSEKRFAQTYCKWILGEWRVGAKDKDKLDDGKYSYKELCQELKQEVGTTKNIENSVIEFLLELDPCRTIPPYQDNNNRKPPKCQSLVLNPKFLDTNYPNWQQYLQELKKLPSIQEYLENFEDELKGLKTSKKLPYFVEQKSSNKQISSGQRDYKDLDARVLQFVFDRVKASDDLLLNEIYSHAKKVKQNASSELEKETAFGKLKTVLSDSNLPEKLKPKEHFDKLSDLKNNIFEQGTFLHLVCKYFKHRQRARDSRVYIMPEYNYDKKLDKWNNTGRFDDKGELLTYCNHKPRQKRYQLLNDLAGVLQVSNSQLLKSVDNWLRQAQPSDETSKSQDEQIFEWLKTFRIGGYCKSAVEMQKQYRGTLKNATQTAVFKKRLEAIKKDKKASDEDKALLEKYSNAKPLSPDEKKLVKLVENINKASQKIGESLGLDNKQIAKFNSLYSFAQIQQIAFAERSGNANTCAVCSADNAHRMQMTKITEHSRSDFQTNSAVTSTGSAILEKTSAKAQRLPAIPTRVVDGAVKKMATILARNIVDDNWDNIKQAINNNQELHIPIITESNAFEFEPALADVKGRSLKDKRKKALEKIKPENIFKDKNNRIKEFAKGISAYSGANLVDGGYDGTKEELDHIIPRSSKKYGTLNDEANLICVSREDNQNRGNTPYYLSNIAGEYKRQQFGTIDNKEITNWITKTIWDAEKQAFKFGNYRSFINLAPDEQKAFRHALFLADDNPIKQAVIKAINNRNRAFVNGTQRYFAEVLANNIYLRAKKENLATSKISFDYFGVETTNTAGRGVTDVRKLYENLDEDINAYAKGDKPQDSYSHLIDAMLAFCVAADEHKNDGSIGLEMGNDYSLFPTPDKFDENTGEILSWHDDDIFRKVKVADSEFGDRVLARRKAYTVETNIRQQIQSKGNFKKAIPYKIHIDSLSAEKYFPLLEISEDKWKYGFTLNNSSDIPKKDIELIQEFLSRSNKYKDYSVWLIDKAQAQEFLVSMGYEGGDKNQEKQAKILDKLSYTTIKKEISSFLAVDKKGKKNNDNKKNTEIPKTVKDAIENFDKCINEKSFKISKTNILLPIYDDWIKFKKAMLKEVPDRDFYNFLADYFKSTNFENKHQKVRKKFSLPVISTIGSIRLRRKSWTGKNVYQVTGAESLAKYGFDGKGMPNTILSKNSVPTRYYSGKVDNSIEPLAWIKIPSDDIDDNNIISAEIMNKEAGKVWIRLRVSSLNQTSLNIINGTWEGKIEYRENALEPYIEKDSICVDKDKFIWFDEFKPHFESNKTKAKINVIENQGMYVIQFMTSKNAKEKQWLKNETPNN